MTTGARMLIAATVMVAAACGPFGPFSGGRLRGPVYDGAVADWSFANEPETVQLETNPADPHSVNTWCWGDGESLYVPTSMILGPTDPTERAWVRHVGADPHVRARIDGTVYERTAVRVEDPDEYARVLAGLYAKYERDPADRAAEREIWIYRLDER